MITINGTGVSDGVAFGKLVFLPDDKTLNHRRHIADVAAELNRLATALEKADEQLSELYGKAREEVGAKDAEIFQVHQMMLEDEDYLDSIRHIVETQMVNAEFAVGTTADNFAEMFEQMEDAYMQARAADVRDVSQRLVNILAGRGDGKLELPEGSVVAASDLSPSQTLSLDKNKICGFVTVGGSANSHTAILARTMGIPAVIKAEGVLACKEGAECIVDGFTGAVYLEPDEGVASAYRKKADGIAEQKRLLQELKGKETVTLSGRKVRLYANIGSVPDVYTALHNDAEGVGLFRTEFIYLESDHFPTEQEQFAVYKQVAETMAGRLVIFRTCDIGADKQAAYFNLDKEENPALGLRGIRLCLTRQEIFKAQLMALYRASAFGKIAIMFPMIISTNEVAQALEIAAGVRRELAEGQIEFDANVELGIMIETPAAALISDELAEMVDFFSIGTNDLTQYTLAIDRQNPALDAFHDPHHPALIKLLKMVADNAHAKGKWVGICGELGADIALLPTFLEMGIDELSVSPAAVLKLRDCIMKSK